MNKPRVLVSMSCLHEAGARKWYVKDINLQCLTSVGFTPMCVTNYPIDLLEEFASLADAIYLPGSDYVPESLGETAKMSKAKAKRNGLVCDLDKVQTDIKLLKIAKKHRIPVLGVCGGFQTMAIFYGSTLRPCSEQESTIHASLVPHEVRTTQNSSANKVFGEAVKADCSHHQTINTLGPDLVATCTSEDGLIEAIEHTDNHQAFILGTQWHPEKQYDLAPFSALADAAKTYKQNR